MAAGVSTDSLWDICGEVTQDTTQSLRRLIFSYHRGALDMSAVPATGAACPAAVRRS
jgi:hypothetical protein